MRLDTGFCVCLASSSALCAESLLAIAETSPEITIARTARSLVDTRPLPSHARLAKNVADELSYRRFRKLGITPWCYGGVRNTSHLPRSRARQHPDDASRHHERVALEKWLTTRGCYRRRLDRKTRGSRRTTARARGLRMNARQCPQCCGGRRCDRTAACQLHRERGSDRGSGGSCLSAQLPRPRGAVPGSPVS